MFRENGIWFSFICQSTLVTYILYKPLKPYLSESKFRLHLGSPREAQPLFFATTKKVDTNYMGFFRPWLKKKGRMLLIDRVYYSKPPSVRVSTYWEA